MNRSAQSIMLHAGLSQPMRYAADRWIYRHVQLLVVSLLVLALPILGGCGTSTAGTPTSAGGARSSPAGTAIVSQIITATPAAGTAVSTSLPQTVTAGGISVTLGLIDTTSTATHFNFSVELPADVVATPSITAVGPPSADDVQITGMPNTSEQPSGVQRNPAPGESTVPFSVEYQSPFPTNQTVTLTISRLAIPNAIVSGPWVFQLTPQMVANQPLPTPAGKVDRFLNISVAEAQKLVGFPIVEPNTLPTGLLHQDFNVILYAVGDTGSAQANYVMLNYPPNPPVNEGVYLIETSNVAAIPTVTNGTYAMLLPTPTYNGTPTTGTIDAGSLSTFTIKGVSVTTFTVTGAGSRQTYYAWTQSGVGYFVRYPADTTSPKQPVSDNDLRQIVASVIQQAG